MPPNSYYIQPRDLGADFRRGSARAHVQGGRYVEAARTIGGDDPDAARSYAAMADRERAQRERDEARSYARSYAGALHRGDYAAAGASAAEYGDPEGVSGARTAQSAADDQERMKMLRGVQQTLGELEQIEANGGQGYDAWWGRAQIALQQNPQMGPEMSGIISGLPKQWNPRVSGALRTRFQRMLESNLDPEALTRLQREERTAARNQRQNLTPEQVAAAGLQPGTVAQTDGSGQIYVVQSPRAPASGGPSGYGTIPSGYRLTGEGDLEPIPGGPAAARVQSAEGKRMGSMLSAMTNNSNVLASIDAADRLSSNDGIGGGTGINQLFSGIPGTTAHNLNAAVDTIVANIGFDRLNEMRMNSPTGGALGNVTERELALLQAVVASLRTSQNNQEFRRNLNRVRDQYVRSMQAIRAAYEQDFGPYEEGTMGVPGVGAAPPPTGLQSLTDEQLQALEQELTGQ